MNSSFSTFLSFIPRAKTLMSPLQGDGEVQGEAESIFVEPGLSMGDVTTAGRGPAPIVVLVSAPAAVGKSHLAKEIARRTNNPVWDLSKYNAGSNFFSGTALELYGPEGYMKFIADLGAGKRCLIVDAADEALVRAGAQSYAAAIDNLSRMIKDAVESVSVVIFGRHDTIGDTRALLEGAGIICQSWSVDFFEEQQAMDFVRLKAGQDGRTVLREMDEFVHTFFAEVQVALSTKTWEDSKSFLGYAPVLDALAAFYRAEENPLKRLNAMRRSAGQGHVWDLLISIVESILEREQTKFADNFGDGDPEKAAFGHAVFTPDFQIALLSSDDPAAIDPDIPGVGDPEWINELTEQVQRQYREHPFLISGRTDDVFANPLELFTNVAFRDYVIARSLALLGKDAAESLLGFWESPLLNPSPLLSHFLFSAHLEPSAPLPSSTLGMIADSHGANLLSSKALLWVEESLLEDDEQADSVIELRISGDTGESSRTLLVSNESRRLMFSRTLANAVASVPASDIALGSGFPDFVIGPDVRIDAGILDSLAPELRVRGRGGVSVTLSVKSIQGLTRRISDPAGGGLSLSVPRAVYPWTAYIEAQNQDQGVVSEEALYWGGMKLRKLIRWFNKKSMNRGSLRYPVEAMDAILRRSRASKSMFAYMQEKEAMQTVEYEYVMKLPFPASVANTNDLSDASYRDFVLGYCMSRR